MRKTILESNIIEALEKAGGIVSLAALSLGMSREGLTKRISKSQKLQEARDESRNTILDLAEAQLVQAVKKGDIRAVMFTLRTLGKSRGWVENSKFELQLEPPKDDGDKLAAMRAALGLPPADEVQFTRQIEN